MEGGPLHPPRAGRERVHNLHYAQVRSSYSPPLAMHTSLSMLLSLERGNG